jgi:hypothetical protein
MICILDSLTDIARYSYKTFKVKVFARLRNVDIVDFLSIYLIATYLGHTTIFKQAYIFVYAACLTRIYNLKINLYLYICNLGDIWTEER